MAYGKKIRVQLLRTGQKQWQPQSHHGPLSRVTEAVQEQLRSWLQQAPDLTEAELRERLQASGVSVCRSRVGQVLRQMGLRRKKNPSMPQSATPKTNQQRRQEFPSKKSAPSRRNG